jgi:lipopolysaccharide export system permease protein
MYKKYIINLFLKKIFYVTIIFYCLVFILNLFEEISFFKNLQVGKFFPLLITLLNVHSTIFIIFPFIFLISTQLFFIEIIEKSELNLLKINGFSNLRLLGILGILAFFLGVLILIFFYNISAKFKFIYLEIKNNYSIDDKYLAVINENGLWIKDNIDNQIQIINAKKIKDEMIENVIINIFNEKFELTKTIIAKNVDISDYNWRLENFRVFIKNNLVQEDKENIFYSNFNISRINGLFKDLSSLNILKLFKLKEDYEKLNYNNEEVEAYIKKIFIFPFNVTLMTLISSIIMLNIGSSKSNINYILLGIFCSVIFYYLTMVLDVMGAGKIISINLSVLLPVFITLSLTILGLVRINEK